MSATYCYLWFLLIIVHASSGLILDIFRPTKWNDLKVTFGLNPFKHFNSMPRTTKEATEEGFVSVGTCDPDSVRLSITVGALDNEKHALPFCVPSAAAAASSSHRGVPYVKDGDKSLVLLYDVNGYIAGIQTVVPDGLPYNYPAAGLTPPFVDHDDGYYLTAYFVPPDIICTKGRSRQEFEDQGTGSVLLIQNGPNPETDYLSVPRKQSDLSGSRWVKGKCFPVMGRHYWHDISKDMNCDEFFPVFLLYNKGKLNGFGWAMGADLPSPRLEHPSTRSYKYFMKDPPTCLYDRGRLSTMHIFLTSRPILNLC